MKLGKNQKYILKWMAENPLECKCITTLELATRVSSTCDMGEASIYQSIHRMIRDHVILQQRYGTSRTSDFYINWNIHTLPKEIMELAPQHVQDAVDETNEKLKSGEYLNVDPYGAGITKEADAEWTVTSDDTDDSDSEEPETKPEPVQVQETVATANTVTVEPTVVKTADGRSISISLTINLNL